MNKKFILSILILFCVNVIAVSQNINNVDVNNLNDSQIQKIVNEIQNRGLTLDQAIILAESRGATPQQIETLKRKIQELQSARGQSIADPYAEKTQSPPFVGEVCSEKAEIKPSEKNKRTFGYQLFNNKNLTFEPSVNLPTPSNYVIGIGDELLITVWGASQQVYQLTVNNNGAVYITDIGPVYISGMSFEKAKILIKKRLTAIYSGMNGDNPNTWAEVSLSNLRSIKINVIGEVNAPGTYNLPSTATAFNALYLSGGPNENGSFRNIKLIRDGKTIQTIDVYDFLINGNTSSNVQLRDQDIIFIPTYVKKVEMVGTFKRNGYFELTDSETLIDLIRYAGNFSEAAYKHRLLIIKYTDKEMKIADVRQEEFSSYIPDNGDEVRADSVVNRFTNRVYIRGAVYRPGNYELTEGLTLSQLIKNAEGLREDVYSNRGLITRENNDRTTRVISFDVNDVINGKIDFDLQKEDLVDIKDIFSMREKRTIQLTGEVLEEGAYPYHDNMTIKDLLFLAGGLKESASESFIEISRRHNYEEASKESSKMVEIYTMDISRDLKLNPADEKFILKPFDHIYVRQAPSYYTQQSVKIEGEVLYPGSYSIKSKNERISDLIKRAGGFTKFAYLEGATIKRSYRVQGFDFHELNKLSDSIGVDSTIRKMQANLLELNLKKIMNNPGSVYDYKLKEGDIISIPTSSFEVRVAGEVMNPIGLAYEKGKELRYYINKTGGFTSNAKKSKIYILYANGTTKVTRNTLFAKSYPRIEPGCQIIVPPKPEKIREDNSGTWIAFASILSSLAIATAAIFR